MTNQHAQFTSADEATLSISVHRGKEAWRVMVRHKPADGKARAGCKEYFELTHETQAQQAYDRRLAEAVANGWVATEKAPRKQAFMAIPMAAKKTEAPTPRLAKK